MGQAGTVDLFTVGHGTLAADRFSALLVSAGVEQLVDVRRAPGSRRQPHFGRAALETWLPEAGVGYRWEARLGGWRRAAPDSPNAGLRNASFRGYADYMGTAEFRDAFDDLVAGAAKAATVVMCSEAVYWRCHRRLISDAAVLLKGVSVLHLDHGGATRPHRLTEGASREGDQLLYREGPPSLFGGLEPDEP
ncbi:MAG TPA: DUF488 domain-containing protein [Acidimicrobiales bacterium]|nr:DUF488 domain-containing protein [Acidimicrobiales bacterium]